MTNKIYRLGDERDVKKIVFCTDLACDTELLKCAQRELIAYRNINGHATYYTSVGSYPYAFVEVTPADFSNEELLQELDKRPKPFASVSSDMALKYYKNEELSAELNTRGLTIYPVKEKTLSDFSIEEMCEAMSDRGYALELNDSQQYIKGLIPKEKTLEDFNDDELKEEISKRGISNQIHELGRSLGRLENNDAAYEECQVRRDSVKVKDE